MNNNSSETITEWLDRWRELFDGIDMDVYILDDNNVPKKVKMSEFISWRSTEPNGVVRHAVVADSVCVSTVFLGINHNLTGVGPPLLFETMVFGGEHHGRQERCSTWHQAEKQHQEVVTMIRRRNLSVVK